MRYPTKIAEFVPWIVDHASTWKAAPTAVGLTAAQATAIDNIAGDLQKAYDAAVKARQASKNATETQNELLRSVTTLLQQDIRIIDAFAANSANPANVYAAAEIDAPTPPQPLPPPGPVQKVTVGIDTITGATILKWKPSGSNGGNISYIVKRKLPGEANYTFVGVAPSSGPDARTFTDNTLPKGVDSVSYTITGQRGSSAGAGVEVNVRFGVVGNAPNFTAVKLAA